MIYIYIRVVYLRDVSCYLFNYILVSLFFSNSIDFIGERGVGNGGSKKRANKPDLFVCCEKERGGSALMLPGKMQWDEKQKTWTLVSVLQITLSMVLNSLYLYSS